MRNTMIGYAGAALAGLAGLALAGGAAAQSYPQKSVRVVVPYPPGGGTDILGRPIAQRLTERLGQSFVIDNRGGATGMIGTDIVAKAPPDGYTVLLSASPEIVANQSLFKTMQYDAVRDLRPVTQVAITPVIIVTIPSLPAKTMKEVIALGRAYRGQLTYATSGHGSPHNIVGELLRLQTGVQLIHVPYKGGGPQVIDTLGGHVAISMFTLPVVTAHVKSGKLRGIAVTVPNRSPAVPQVPTMAESGFPGFDVSQWFAVFVPQGTSAEIVRILHTEVTEALKVPEIRARQLEQGYEPVGSTPDAFAQYVKAEIAKYAKLIKDTGIRIEQ